MCGNKKSKIMGKIDELKAMIEYEEKRIEQLKIEKVEIDKKIDMHIDYIDRYKKKMNE